MAIGSLDSGPAAECLQVARDQCIHLLQHRRNAKSPGRMIGLGSFWRSLSLCSDQRYTGMLRATLDH